MEGHTDCELRPICRRSNVVLGIGVRAIKCEIKRRDLARFYSCFCLGSCSCESHAEDGGEESEGKFHLDEVSWECGLNWMLGRGLVNVM